MPNVFTCSISEPRARWHADGSDDHDDGDTAWTYTRNIERRKPDQPTGKRKKFDKANRQRLGAHSLTGTCIHPFVCERHAVAALLTFPSALPSVGLSLSRYEATTLDACVGSSWAGGIRSTRVTRGRPAASTACACSLSRENRRETEKECQRYSDGLKRQGE
jgi:hypothetical protein